MTKYTKIEYTVLHINRQVLFGAGNQGNHQNFEKSLLFHKSGLIFIGIKQIFFFFWKKKFKMAHSKKTSFSSSANSQYFFMKISWIGPWVGRIERRALVWLNLYGREAVWHKLKNRQKTLIFFCQFLSLCQTASRPYRLSHINALRINQSY